MEAVTRVKICGITRQVDALRAAALGVDAIGLVFAAASPRNIEPEVATQICTVLPPFVTRIGLFMNAGEEQIRAVLARVPLDGLQFHGEEPEDFCRRFQRPYIKAVAMGGSAAGVEASGVPDQYPSASALLLDSHSPGTRGGTGTAFDWCRIGHIKRPWILAGGLSPDNVRQAISALSPPAVDVSSGVELRPGIKDHQRMEAFMEAIRHG